MPIFIVVGMQWGDEGKGRIVDLLSQDVDIVARYNGGDNAGHTVTVGDKIYKLHIVPSGIIHPQTIGVLGNGLVINPNTLTEEIKMLRDAGVEIDPERLWISDVAHLISPAHRMLDQAQEAARGKSSIGTTGRGIGPAYVDKSARRGLRMGDMAQTDYFKKRIHDHFSDANNLLTKYYDQPAIDVKQLSDTFYYQCIQFKPFVRSIGPDLRNAIKDGKTILAEGAQGTLLDLDHGTYPFVTSSCTTATGIFSGLSLGIQPVQRVVGVTKAFQTRVGSGPFPTELDGEMAALLRGTGSNPWDEFGTTTGRPRRVGWLDLMLLKYTVEINGATELFITKLDILSGISELQVCTAYERNKGVIQALDFTGGAHELADCTPAYRKVPGWNEDLTKLRKWNELPQAALDYLMLIEDFCGIPVTAVSVGPERNAIIFRG